MRIAQILLAALAGVAMFFFGEATDPTYVLLSAAVLSLATPRRFMWFTLAIWGFHFAAWAGFELYTLMNGGAKWGLALAPFAIAAIVFWVASWLSLHKVTWTSDRLKNGV